jgi:molybdate transport repressor ModE-like protein
MKIEFSINWKIKNNEEVRIDPILFILLSAIKQKGSLKAATQEAHASYRFAWGLLTKWEAFIGQPLVLLERGRGASLSEMGEKLLNSNFQLQAQFSPALDNLATQFKQDFESILIKNNPRSINIFASHGLAVDSLRNLITEQNSFKLDLHFHGSLESLRALQNGECDIAGFHIPTGSIAKQLRSDYLKLLNPKQHQLIYIVKRNQGLMTQTENPKGIDSIHSLSDKNVRFINRQKDSGTRLLFDQLLKNEKINPAHIDGYQHEEFTHMAVAAMIASGIADAGFGIAPMADKFKLRFIPLIWEHYCLAVPRHIVNDERVSKIIALLQSASFKKPLSDLKGYDTGHSGEIIDFDTIFG